MTQSWWFVTPVDEDGRRDVGFAKALVRNRAYALEQRHQMLDGEPVERWTAIDYFLEDGDFGDYPRELEGYRLCSERLREVIETNKSDLDPLEWLPASVQNQDGERRSYWILNILRHPAMELPGLEEMDWQNLKACAAKGDLSRFHILPPPGLGLISFLVSEELRDHIVKAGCSVAFRSL